MLVNDDLQASFDNLLAILRAERLRRPRIEPAMGDFVARLLSE